MVVVVVGGRGGAGPGRAGRRVVVVVGGAGPGRAGRRVVVVVVATERRRSRAGALPPSPTVVAAVVGRGHGGGEAPHWPSVNIFLCHVHCQQGTDPEAPRSTRGACSTHIQAQRSSPTPTQTRRMGSTL